MGQKKRTLGMTKMKLEDIFIKEKVNFKKRCKERHYEELEKNEETITKRMKKQ